MDNNISLLKEWIDSLGAKEEDIPVLKTIHIDELIKKPGNLTGGEANKTIFLKSLEIYYELINIKPHYHLYADYSASLCFLLKCSNQIMLDIEEGNIWDNLSYTPPSLYLTPISNFVITKKIEIYQKPLILDVFKNFQNNCFINYKCARTIEDMQNDREYFREIEIENFKA